MEIEIDGVHGIPEVHCNFMRSARDREKQRDGQISRNGKKTLEKQRDRQISRNGGKSRGREKSRNGAFLEVSKISRTISSESIRLRVILGGVEGILGVVLGRLCGFLGCPGVVLGSSWRVLKSLRNFLGRPGKCLGWSVLLRRYLRASLGVEVVWERVGPSWGVSWRVSFINRL